MLKKILCALLFIFMMPAMAVSAAADNGPPDIPPGAGVAVEPGYTRHEPGRWEQTGILFYGTTDTERTVDGVTVKAVFEKEKEDIIYIFTDENGKTAVYTVSPYWFPDWYYAESSFSVGVNIVRSPDDDAAPGSVSAAVVIAELTEDEGRFGYTADVQSFFKLRDGTEIQKFGVNENMTFSTGSEGKYYIDLVGKLPVGEAGGQKLYAVVGVQDDFDRETRAFIAYEYTWKDVPEEIEVPPENGPIEHHNGGLIILGIILVSLILVLLIAIFIIRRIVKNKKNSRSR